MGAERKLQFLLVPSGIAANYLEISAWKALRELARVETLDLPDQSYLLQDVNSGGQAPTLDSYFHIAQPYRDRFDFIIGEGTGGFLWHAIFRLMEDQTPFVIVPHFNHVALANAYAAFLSSQLALPCDILFGGSHSASQAFSQLGFHCDPLYPLGIDPRFRCLQESKATLRSSLGLPHQVDTLFYAGRFSRDKNLRELLEIVDIVRQKRPVQLVVCHRHAKDTDYYRACLEYAGSIGGVYLVPSPSKQDLVRYYNAADLFVSAAVSEYENFGTAPVEAMACGIPPVVSEYDGFRDKGIDSCGMLIPVAFDGHTTGPDVPEFAQAIIALLADVSVLEAKSRCAVENAGRFQRPLALQSMLARLSDLPCYPRDSMVVTRCSLGLYPRQIRSLWLELEGKPIEKLLSDFLQTFVVPVEPAESALREFRDLWFSSF